VSTKTLNVDPIPVSIVKSEEELTSLAPEFGSTSNFSLPLIGTAQPVQILQRRPTRTKAVLSLDSFGGSIASVPAEGEAPLPVTAGQIIATTAALPAGTYIVQGNNMLSGAGTVADINNISLNIGSTPFITLGNGDANEVLFPFGPITVVVPAGGATISTRTIGVGGGTANYWSSFTATPVGTSGGASAVMIAYRPDYLANPNNPQGFIIASVPRLFQWESQQPCYAVAIGAGPVTINVIDQAQAASQSQAEEAVQDEDYTLQQSEGGRQSGTDRYPSQVNEY